MPVNPKLAGLHAPSGRLLALRRPLTPAHRRSRCPRGSLPARVVAFTERPYSEVHAEAEAAYNRASDLLPTLEAAQRVAAEAREPAAEAERCWRDAHDRLSEVAGRAHAAISELRDGAEAALGGGGAVAGAMLRHHARRRLDAFKSERPDVTLWRRFPPTLAPLGWLPGAQMLTQVAACTSEGVPCLVACVAVAAPPLHDDAPRSLLLHWSVADGPGAGWANSIPQGWHTSPGVSQPCGATAWQTALAPHAPTVAGAAATSASVFSVVVQIPMEGFLEDRGGLKFVLKRTDGEQPEWIKPGNNADFWVDFGAPIAMYRRQREAEAAAEAADLARAQGIEAAEDGTATDLAADALDAWGWARAMSDSSSDDCDGEGVTEDDDGAQDDDAEDAAAAAAPSAAWLAGVEAWEALGDYPPQQPPSLSSQVQQLRLILSAAQTHPPMIEEADEGSAAASDKVAALLARCHEVDETLQTYDAASFEARRTQHEKERLWELHRSASDQAADLQAELSAVLEAARRGAVALRGRRAEVTQRDVEVVAAQMAEASSGSGGVWPLSAFSGRQLVFVSQYVASVAGMDATVVAQVYLEGERGGVQAALQRPTAATPEGPSEESKSSEAKESSESGFDTDKQPKEPEKSPFDALVVAVAVGETFPSGCGALRPPALLHFGVVPNQGGKWRPPPPGWKSHPGEGAPEGAPAPGSLPWIPLQPYAITKKDGGAAFVDPLVQGACLRLPLTEVAAARARGVEFVLKTADGGWLQPGAGGNFYVELPALIS